MKILKTLLLFFLVLSSFYAKSQENFTLKTTEFYFVEFPSDFGDFKHSANFFTWDFDIKNKKIIYQDRNSRTNTFYFTSMTQNKNSTSENSIIHFDNSKESITLILKKGNYTKILFATDKEPNIEPASYTKIGIFTNYIVNEFSALLSQ